MPANADDVRRFLTDRLQEVARRQSLAIDISATGFNLLDSGLLDSLGFVELIAAIETRFQIEIDITELEPEEYTTLEGLIQCAVGSHGRSDP